MAKISFNFYGFYVLIASSSYKEAELCFLNDFSHFRISYEQNKNFNLKIYLSKSNDFSKYGVWLGKTRLSEFRQVDFKTRQYIYSKNSKNIASSFDRINLKKRFFYLKSAEVEAINEILYYYILSTVGEYFDSVGIMRVHACAFTQIGQGSTLIWGLPGAGKSTLATLLSLSTGSKHLQVLSDELSLVDLNENSLRPFPMRFSLKKDVAFLINKRLEVSHHQKISLHSKGFFFDKKYTFDNQSQPQTHIQKAQLSQFYILEKSYTFGIEEITFVSRFKLYFRLIFGIGLIQMYEYFIRFDNISTLFKIFCNRLRLCACIQKLPIQLIKRGSNFNTDTQQSVLFFLRDKSN